MSFPIHQYNIIRHNQMNEYIIFIYKGGGVGIMKEVNTGFIAL
jgi:predicted Rossmann-fold nucleotide-binding protein